MKEKFIFWNVLQGLIDVKKQFPDEQKKIEEVTLELSQLKEEKEQLQQEKVTVY